MHPKSPLSNFLSNTPEHSKYLQQIANPHNKNVDANFSSLSKPFLTITEATSQPRFFTRSNIKNSTIISNKSKLPLNNSISNKKSWSSITVTAPEKKDLKEKLAHERTYPLPSLISIDAERQQTLNAFLVRDELKNTEREKKLKYHDLHVDRSTDINEIELQKNSRLTVLKARKKNKGTMFFSELWDRGLYAEVIKKAGLGAAVQKIKKSRYQSQDDIKVKQEQTYQHKHEKQIEVENADFSKLSQLVKSQKSFDQSSKYIKRKSPRLHTIPIGSSCHTHKSKFFDCEQISEKRRYTILLPRDNEIPETHNIQEPNSNSVATTRKNSQRCLLKKSLVEDNDPPFALSLNTLHFSTSTPRNFISFREARKVSLDPSENMTDNFDNMTEAASIIITSPKSKFGGGDNDKEIRGRVTNRSIKEKFKTLLNNCTEVSQSTTTIQKDMGRMKEILSLVKPNRKIRTIIRSPKPLKETRSSSMSDCFSVWFKKP